MSNQIHFPGEVSGDQLRELIMNAKRIPFYDSLLYGYDLNGDANDILDRLPFFNKTGYIPFQQDVFNSLEGTHFYIDHTSGTTGKIQARFSNYQEDEAEGILCRRFFEQCRLTPDDRILATDIDSSYIYYFYAEVLSRMGVINFCFTHYTHDEPQVLQLLEDYKPTVILSVPTILDRLSMRIINSGAKKVIYFAESMPDKLRHEFGKNGIQPYSFYGATEIGSMSGECNMHNGIHIYNDAVIPTLINPMINDDGNLTGRVAWTTMHFTERPLIKYMVGDVVTISGERCRCGSPYPLMIDIHREDQSFSMFGHLFHFEEFESLGSDIEIEIVSNGHVTFHFSKGRTGERVPEIRKKILLIEEFGDLVDIKLIKCKIEKSKRGRKSRKVIDRR